MQIGTWLWNHLLRLWERSPAVVSTTRMVATGQVAPGAHKLYWVACNPSAGNSDWAITDDTAALGVIIVEHFHTDRESHNTNFIPHIQFHDGIWLERLVAMTSMTFGYV